MKTARIRIPGSTANLGPAFDAVGIALQLYLTVQVSALPSEPSRIDVAGEDAHLIPCDETNLIWRAMRRVAERRGRPIPPFAMQVTNQIPITRGLGSSSAACLAGAAAADFLCGMGCSREEFLQSASDFEGHPDNVAPSLYGGIVASISNPRVLCTRSEFPAAWTVVAVTPEFELQTSTARSVLPSEVKFAHAVLNVQNTAFLMTQLIHGRTEGVREAMSDFLHQPYRFALVPGLEEILELEDCDGLIGVSLSGAGPTVIALADSNEDEIGNRICSIFSDRGLKAKARPLKADTQGMVIEDMTITG
jgi:homoserine kinase